MSRHGFSIGMERSDDKVYIAMKAFGKLTHQDYQSMTPLLDSALAGVSEQSLDLVLDLSEFEGWELRAAWDDMKLGLKHGNEFRKIALYGHSDWLSWAAKVAGWFVAGETKYFESRNAALAWLST